MQIKKATQCLELLKDEIKWEHPPDYKVKLENIISDLKRCEELEKEISKLIEKYEYAKSNEYVKDKKGWALYHAWKEVAR